MVAGKMRSAVMAAVLTVGLWSLGPIQEGMRVGAWLFGWMFDEAAAVDCTPCTGNQGTMIYQSWNPNTQTFGSYTTGDGEVVLSAHDGSGWPDEWCLRRVRFTGYSNCCIKLDFAESYDVGFQVDNTQVVYEGSENGYFNCNDLSMVLTLDGSGQAYVWLVGAWIGPHPGGNSDGLKRARFRKMDNTEIGWVTVAATDQDGYDGVDIYDLDSYADDETNYAATPSIYRQRSDFVRTGWSLGFADGINSTNDAPVINNAAFSGVSIESANDLCGGGVSKRGARRLAATLVSAGTWGRLKAIYR